MSAISSFYPEFVANQILTNTQLNQLRTHLDVQERQTRIRLIGVGKVCGLNWSIAPDQASLTIDEGYGVTSDGYLVTLSETTLTHYRTYRDPSEEDDGPRYRLWETKADQDIKELLDAQAVQAVLEAEAPIDEENGDNDPKLLTELTLADYVVVLYLEKEPIDLNSCLVTECDNKGLNINLNVRVLLIPKDNDERIEEMSTLISVLTPRVHTKILLQDIHELTDLYTAFGGLSTDMSDALLNEIQTVFRQYGPWLGLQAENAITDIKAVLNGIRASSAPQHFYDSALDFVSAYEELLFHLRWFHQEFGVSLIQFYEACCPEFTFPRHLMLGALSGESGFCHEFVSAPVDTRKTQLIDRIRKLFLRLWVMAKSLSFLTLSKGIRITPSHIDAYPLSKRAIPFYFNFTEDMKDHWNPKPGVLPESLWSYHIQDPASDTNSFDYDYNRSTFLRIEGHFQLDCDVARETIKKLRTLHNLEFDVFCLFLNDQHAEESLAAQQVLNHVLKLEKTRNLRLELFMRALANPGKVTDEDLARMKAAFEESQRQDERLVPLYRDWADKRQGPKLLCDASWLEADYLRVREEMLCVLQHVKSVIPAVTVDISENVAVPDSLEPDERLVLLFLTVAAFIHETLASLVERYLPASLTAFSLPIFSNYYRSLLKDLITFYLLAHEILVVGNVRAGVLKSIPFSYVEKFKADHAYGIQQVLRDCTHRELISIYYQYAFLRKHDLSQFENFAGKYDGLEHLAGVEKGGTFFLICDREDETTPQVVADFSFAGKVDCCCPIDITQVCLPPVANTVYKTVRLSVEMEEGEEQVQPVSMSLNLLERSYDTCNQSILTSAEEADLEVILKDTDTEQGGKLVSGGNGTVKYFNDSPPLGGVDRFVFFIKRTAADEEREGNCPQEDMGHGIILFVPPLEIQLEPTTGHIKGRVQNTEGGVAPMSVVRIIETNLTTTADANGEFSFADLPARQYRLQATLGNQVSGQHTVNVLQGQTSSVILALRPASGTTGTLLGTVRKANQMPVPGASVVLSPTGAKQTTTVNGVFTFQSLTPGAYKVRAVAGELRSPVISFEIQQGESTNVNLVVTGNILNVVFPITNKFSRRVADLSEATESEVRMKAEEIYGGRYQTYLSTVDEAGENEVIQKTKTYEAAKAFVMETLPQSDLAEEQLIIVYRKAASLLASTIKRSTNEENKAVYRQLLSSASLGLMDRLTLHDPENLSEDAAEAMTEMAEKLKEAEVDLNAVKREFNVKILSRELKVTSPGKMSGLLR
ncbi:MAG: hypothetical protein NPIRA05_01710 [Nitrospirales bacterium]|nr:MAG: hypothetical protein NPIRA05_01710 [Nitrospirales bacterium]